LGITQPWLFRLWPRLFNRHVDLQLNQVKVFTWGYLAVQPWLFRLWPRLFNRHVDLQLNQVKVFNGCPYTGNIFTFKIGFTAHMFFFTLKIK
jgi:hypothetical protein